MFNKSKKDNTIGKGNLLMFFKQFTLEDPEDLQGDAKMELILVLKLANMIIETCSVEGDADTPAEGGISMSEFSSLLLKLFDNLCEEEEEE